MVWEVDADGELRPGSLGLLLPPMMEVGRGVGG